MALITAPTVTAEEVSQYKFYDSGVHYNFGKGAKKHRDDRYCIQNTRIMVYHIIEPHQTVSTAQIDGIHEMVINDGNRQEFYEWAAALLSTLPELDEQELKILLGLEDKDYPPREMWAKVKEILEDPSSMALVPAYSLRNKGCITHKYDREAGKYYQYITPLGKMFREAHSVA